MIDKILFMATAWHEYPDNWSGGQAVSGIGDLFSYANYSVGNMLGAFLLIAIASIGFLSMKSTGHPASKALTAILYVSTLIATIMMAIGIMSFWIPMMLAIITVIMGLVVRNESNMGL